MLLNAFEMANIFDQSRGCFYALKFLDGPSHNLPAVNIHDKIQVEELAADI